MSSEPDYKAMLAEYHGKLMEISRRLREVRNEQPRQKDQGAAQAGMDFNGVVTDFQAAYGHLFK